ncbi:MAG: iron ABC transporter ATP-binding protein [Euryarchaeota archaeon]|nr:iron ABC transporter ATP-binding protein [Euryarchaeota archaeon]
MKQLLDIDVLKVSNLSFSWKNNPVPVLSDIEFSVRDGELVAILGINGAGKSTLLKCMNRILKPENAEIQIDSMNINDISLLELSKLVSYVPQSVMTNFSMDVFDVVMLGRRPHISWRISNEDRDKVSKTLQLFDLEDFAFRRFDQLSGGERQRVIVAKAVVQSPSLFLFDEPTSDLDLKNQLEVMKRIRDLVDNKERRAALVAVHDINLAARFADRIILLHNGRIKAFNNPKSVLTEQNNRRSFRCKMHDSQCY